MNTIKAGTGNTKIVAHRGVSGIETENTASAFVAAGNRSYFGIETDVHVTADGKLVCIHDESTKRVSNEDINVEQSTFEKVMCVRLRDRNSGERRDLRIPSLSDYITICKTYEKVCVLELKNHFEQKYIEAVIDEYRKASYLDHVIFISFDKRNLIEVRKLLPKQPLQYLVCKPLDDTLIKELKEFDFDVDICYTDLTAEGVKAAHENGIEVNCWTCDKPEEAQKLSCWGVDYITSNILE